MKIETKVFTGFVLLGTLIASNSIYLARSASERLTRGALVYGGAIALGWD
jgi:hypothetical protein